MREIDDGDDDIMIIPTPSECVLTTSSPNNNTFYFGGFQLWSTAPQVQVYCENDYLMTVKGIKQQRAPQQRRTGSTALTAAPRLVQGHVRRSRRTAPRHDGPTQIRAVGSSQGEYIWKRFDGPCACHHHRQQQQHLHQSTKTTRGVLLVPLLSTTRLLPCSRPSITVHRSSSSSNNSNSNLRPHQHHHQL